MKLVYMYICILWFLFLMLRLAHVPPPPSPLHTHTHTHRHTNLTGANGKKVSFGNPELFTHWNASTPISLAISIHTSTWISSMTNPNCLYVLHMRMWRTHLSIVNNPLLGPLDSCKIETASRLMIPNTLIHINNYGYLYQSEQFVEMWCVTNIWIKWVKITLKLWFIHF